MNSTKHFLRLLAFGLLAIVPLQAGNSSNIRTPLTNTGVLPDARGAVIGQLKLRASELHVSATKLTPGSSVDVVVGGVVEATATVRANGRLSVKFKAPNAGRAQPLDFDPRGRTLSLAIGGQSVLEAIISATGEPQGTLVAERANLTPGAGVAGKARAEYRVSRNDKRVFRVDLERAGAGPFELFVGGVKRGDLTVRGVTARIKFAIGSDDPGVLQLDFDPRGEVIDVISNAQVVFSGKLEALARGVNVSTPRFTGTAITATALAGSGHANAKLRLDTRARKHFSVEVEDMPVGAYDLFVDGVNVGTITVATVTGGTEGEIEFNGGDDDPNELPLTFDPLGKTLSIRQGADVFFESVFEGSLGTGAGTPRPEPASDLEELLTSTGLDADAKAAARYRVDDRGRHKFDVEIEKVAAGNYTLTVAGVVRGTIKAVATASGVEGELEFDSKVEPGHRPLNFDPRGQFIEISDAAGVYFSHLLGSGSAAGGGGGNAATPFETEVPLFNAGVDPDARAKAELKQFLDGQQNFEVRIEDVAVGAYDLSVGGTVRGTINVVADASRTRGQLEFETTPGSGHLLLDFAVAGQEIVISQGGTTYFSRNFPNP
ncbi:MAG: hypothetical protein ABMA13_17695 [Chthoniobacteraceae bacterium]